MDENNIWYSVSLGDGMWAPTVSAQIEKAFQPLFAETGKPSDMAVFTRSESEGRLHCEVIAYFSPAAGSIARNFNAQPCNMPVRNGLDLLAGDPQCWAAFFPEDKT